MADGQVIFEISGDDRQIIETLRRVTQEIERNSRDWDDRVDDSSDNMQRAFNRAFDVNRIKEWALEAGKAILGFAKDAVQAASDLEEVQNVVDTTFGASAGQIDNWAKNAIKQFGLTETQAKRFASTIGAMAKSAGVAGPEIVEMSTDIAGLAADMASFYNLDFDEAFQKLRSGISGETEPLKQLGINMSVANLNAYALAQGLEKTFEQMDQAEQTMLRYQYIMQATADAQGDFARTSDGFANGMRLLESNVDSLKTKLGENLLPIVSDVVKGLNSFVGVLFPTETHEHTVLDDFAQIDRQTAEKLADIQATTEQALALVQTMNDLSGETTKAEGLTGLVNSLSTHFGGMKEAMDAAKQGDYAGTISGIAGALALDTGADATKWETLLTAIGDNLGDATGAVDADGKKTPDWLTAAAQAADDLGGEYPGLWQDLVGTLGSDAAANMVEHFATAATGENRLEALAEAANALEAGSAPNWSRFLTAVQNVSGITNLFGSNADDAAKNIKDMAEALAGDSVTTDRAQAWKTLLGALSENAAGLTGLTGTSAEETSSWLTQMAEAANAIDPNDAAAWETFMSAFVGGLPGLGDTEDGESAMEALLNGAQGVGQAAQSAIDYLSLFGMESDDIADAQAKWLEVCRRLVKEIPGLSEIINTETGEVKGGTQAIKEYIDEWQQAQIRAANMDAYLAKRSEYMAERDAIVGYQVDRDVAYRLAQQEEQRLLEAHTQRTERGRIIGHRPTRAELDAALKEYQQLIAEGSSRLDSEMGIVSGGTLFTFGELENLLKYEKEYREADKVLGEHQHALEKAEEKLAVLDEMYADDAAAIEADTAAQEANNAAREAAAEAIDNATTALQAMDDYMAKVREETATTVASMVKGFESIVTPADKARQELEKLDKVGEDGQINERWQSVSDSIATIGNMTAGLMSQVEYMDRYMEALELAKSMGFNEQMLASLADGSAESLDYLEAMTANGVTQDQVDAMNAAWEESQAKQEAFTDALTATKLDADAEFQSIVQSATDAIAGLDQYSEAEGAMASTVQGIADGIAAAIPSVQLQVDALNNVLSQIGGQNLGVNFAFGKIMTGSKGTNSGWTRSYGLSANDFHPHAVGLDYVPYDNYLAALHEGETILTAEEARVWRNFKTGATSSRNNIDYGALSGAIWDSAPSMGGGNVYLDGRTVGRVISGAQADSYRALERSGWQG